MIDKKDNDVPPVAVIMTTYNDESYIDEAIKSVLNQTMSNFSFVIIDDASTDSTPHILAKHTDFDRRIRVVRNESNLGLTKSLNVGLKYSDSPFIARLDADDVCTPERLEKQLVYMQTHPECDFLGTRAIVIDEAGHYIKKTKIWPSDMNVKRYLLEYGSPFVHSSMMIRRSTLDELGGYNEEWSARQDYELWLRAVFNKKQLDCLDDCCIYYRFHRQSVSVSSEASLACNLILRGYYRAKDSGIEIDVEELKKRIEKSYLLQEYIKHVKTRREIKNVISDIYSMNIVLGAYKAFKAIYLYIRSGVYRKLERINCQLDQLCKM